MGGVFRTTVGNVELVALQDSWFTARPEEFFPNSVQNTWAAEFRDYLNPEGEIAMAIAVFALRSQGKTILVDTGLGPREKQRSLLPIQEPPHLPTVMAEAGIHPTDVDLIVYSHMHFDHTGWNTIDQDGKRAPFFPNARHIIQRAEWDYWTANDERRRFALFNMLHAPIVEAGLLDLVEGEYAVTSEIVTVLTPGHTPGHVSFVVASGGERAYILGDSTHHPAQLTCPEWYCTADVDPAESTRGRKALMERMEAENALIADGHFPFPGLGRAKRVNGRRVFDPVS